MKDILVIDDSKFNLMVVEKALHREYRVTTRKSGKEGINFLKDNHADLILLDIEMPEINGMDTFKIMRHNPKMCRIPVIFLTGLQDDAIETTCLDLGARDFITKPFNEPVMLQRIKNVLELEDLRKNLEIQVKHKTETLEKLTAQMITTFTSSQDPLTGLWSRIYMEAWVNGEISKDYLSGALAIIDIDNFRKFNETLGYKKGDICLIEIAKAVSTAINSEDNACRSSRDEFIVYFPKVSNREQTEEKLKRIFENADSCIKENKFSEITLSAGVTMTIDAGGDFNALYHCADKVLYQIKKKGKNSFAFYSHSQE